ncbi:MAG: hypothetical protein JWO93_3029 [Micrococcaceae bacterium]|nr:hypothetical protein [Micrococcaceae bacterium]
MTDEAPGTDASEDAEGADAAGDAQHAEAPEQPLDRQAVQADLNRLVGTALGVAQEQLEAYGAFLPVAVVLGRNGEDEVRLLAVSPDSGSQNPDDSSAGQEPDADSMIADLYEALRQQRDQHRAAAVLVDVTLPDEGTDAVHVVAEHWKGVAVAAVQPYAQGAEGWTFQDPFWEAGQRLIWD